MAVRWLERQRNGRMAPFLRGVIWVVAITAGVALAAYLAVAFGGFALSLR